MSSPTTTTAITRSAREPKTPCDVISGDDDLDKKHNSNSDHEEGNTEAEGEEAEEEEVEEEVEEDIVTELSRIKIPPNVSQRGNVNVPKLIKFNKQVFDCPYLVSCHVISSILSTNLILGLTSPEELKEMAMKNISTEGHKKTEYSHVDRDTLINHFETILQVDPYMYCWTNFHLSYLYSHWNIVGKNTIASLDYAQQRLRLRAWYYVIIYLCRKIPLFPDLLSSLYLYSVIPSIGKVLEVKRFSELMRSQKLCEPSGVDTEHWINIQVYLTSYSQDDRDPLGDNFDAILELLISAGKIKKQQTEP
jgi:hypothetical protein